MKLMLRDEQKTIKDRYIQSTELVRRFNKTVRNFGRDIRHLFKGQSITDPHSLKGLVSQIVQKFVGKTTEDVAEAYTILLEDGMAQVGVDVAKYGLNPNMARALLSNSPVWKAYQSMSQDLNRKTNETIIKHLLREDGISYNKLTVELQDIVGMSERRARVIARTETQAVLNKGAEIGFRIVDPDNLYRFKWGGPYDNRTADSCQWIHDQIPREGVTLDQLKQLVNEATRRFHKSLTPREWTPHPNCRHHPQKVRRATLAK